VLSLDALIDSVVIQAQVESGGLSQALAAKRATTPAGRRAALVASRPDDKLGRRNPTWSPQEDAFLKANLFTMSDEEIGRQLGRSKEGVHIRRERELGLPTRSNNPAEMTAEQIAEGLGVDGKSIHRLIDRGILPGRRLPLQTVCRVVERATLLRWLVNPMHWIYFDPDRVGRRGPRRTKRKYDAAFWQKARRLVQLRRARWDDAWWTPGQVARHHELADSAAVNNYIHDGKLPATKWGNWRILRSDALRVRFFTGKGKGLKRGVQFSEGGDAFVVLARAVGLSWTAIGALMKLPDDGDQAVNRLSRLHREHAITELIHRHDLKVNYDRRSGFLFADWKRYRRRFPGIDRAMRKLRTGETLTYRDRLYVCGVLRVWAERFYRGRDRKPLLQSLRFPHTRGERSIRQMLARLRAQGVDPFERA